MKTRELMVKVLMRPNLSQTYAALKAPAMQKKLMEPT